MMAKSAACGAIAVASAPVDSPMAKVAIVAIFLALVFVLVMGVVVCPPGWGREVALRCVALGVFAEVAELPRVGLAARDPANLLRPPWGGYALWSSRSTFRSCHRSAAAPVVRSSRLFRRLSRMVRFSVLLSAVFAFSRLGSD